MNDTLRVGDVGLVGLVSTLPYELSGDSSHTSVRTSPTSPTSPTLMGAIAPFAPSELGLPGLPWDVGVCRLQFMPTPDGWEERPWRAIQVGCLALAAGWGARLAQLRWTEAEAFGLDPCEPANRERWGLGLLVGWGEVVDLDCDRARFQAADGTGRKFWRRPLPNSIPLWDAVRWSA